MTPPPIILATLLAVAVVVAWVGLLRGPTRGWRRIVLLACQPVTMTLLYLTLQPPMAVSEAGTLVVLTRGATAAGGTQVAMPEAPAVDGATRVPDLATALRRYPGTARLRIVGDGLEPRDRDAAAGLAVAFDPGASPRGLVRLDPPGHVAPGGMFRVGGRVDEVPGGRIELLDPAGERVRVTTLPASGQFVVDAAARAAGLARFSLRVRDARGVLVEAADVPVATIADSAPRLLIIAGAAGPELKYLRRWADDAGLSTASRIDAGAGLRLGRAPPLTSAALRDLDVVIVDERGWSGLSALERDAIRTAVRAGLGLMLRVGGPVDAPVRRQWAALGLSLAPGDATVTSMLTGDPPVAVTRFALAAPAPGTVPLLRDRAGTVIAAWRAAGRGRIALWPLTDSFAAALAGQTARHAELWSQAIATIARARSEATPMIASSSRVGDRVVLCRLPDAPAVVAPGGEATTLVVDPATPGCAAYWPRAAGWHSVRSARGEWPFDVAPATVNPGIRALDNRNATFALVTSRRVSDRAAGTARRTAAWPWFVAWLAISAALWWFERRRAVG